MPLSLYPQGCPNKPIAEPWAVWRCTLQMWLPTAATSPSRRRVRHMAKPGRRAPNPIGAIRTTLWGRLWLCARQVLRPFFSGFSSWASLASHKEFRALRGKERRMHCGRRAQGPFRFVCDVWLASLHLCCSLCPGAEAEMMLTLREYCGNEGVASGRSAKPSMQMEYSCLRRQPRTGDAGQQEYPYWSRSDGCLLGLQVRGRYWLLVGRRC